MVMNFNYGYPMTNSYPMNHGNVRAYYKAKYGCDDCFRKTPYPFEYPKQFTPSTCNEVKPSALKTFLNKIFKH